MEFLVVVLLALTTIVISALVYHIGFILQSVDAGKADFGRAGLRPRKFSTTTTTVRSRKVPGADDDASSTASASTRNGGCPRCSSAGWDRESSPSASEFLIEEKTEEVTVTVEENESEGEEDELDEDGCKVVEESSSGVRTSGDEETWSSSQSASGTPTRRNRRKDEVVKRVPFPEYGLDIVEETSELGSDSDDMSVRCVSNESWEENWLFQRQRAVGKWWGDDMVPMLIPNPNCNAVPRIGDRDIDELSELSEHNSCGSLEFSSSSSSSSSLSGEPASSLPAGADADVDLDVVHVRADVAVRRDDSFRSDVSAASNVSARHDLSAKVEFGQKDSEYTEDYAAYVDRRPKMAAGAAEEEEENDRAGVPVEKEEEEGRGTRNEVRPKKVPGARVPPNRDGRPTTGERSGGKTKQPIAEAVNKVELIAVKSSGPLPVARKEPPPTGDKEGSLFVQPALRREPPAGLRMTLTPDTLSIHAGKAFKLRCSIEGREPLRVIWFHNGEVLTPSDHVRIFSSSSPSSSRGGLPRQHFHCLHRFDTGVQDAGTYSIVAVCRDGDGWQDAHVLVRGSSRAHHPPRFTAPLKAVCRPEKREAGLECQVDGYPEPEVVFKRVTASGSGDGDGVGEVEVELSPADYHIESTLYGEWSVRFDLDERHPEAGAFVAVCRNVYGEVQSRAVLDCGSVGWHRSTSVSSDRDGAAADDEDSRETAFIVELDKPRSRSALSAVARKKSKSPGKRSKGERSPGREKKSKEAKAKVAREAVVIPDLPPSDPPKPGTIAAREHEKWLHAKPIPNNPYSMDKLVQRISRRDSSSFSGSVDSILSLDGEELDGNGSSRRVNCGPKEIDPALYRRDYYVKSGKEGRGRPKSWVLSPEPKLVGPPVNRVPTPANDDTVTTGCVAENIAKLTSMKDRRPVSTPEPHLAEEPVTLPSVRDLTKKFSSK